VKIAVIGGGSTYTPELADGFARLAGSLSVTELSLIDPAAERLEVVGRFCARLFDMYGHSGHVTWTTSLAGGLDGADAVLIQLRVGGQRARISDETFPLAYGCIGQETTGAGGLAKALRTVPVVLSIAEQAARLAAPNAWIIDFTNPVGIMTRALLDAGHRAIGLCNVAIGFQRSFATLLGVSAEEVELDHIGLNHLTWERAVRVHGQDVLPQLLARHVTELAAQVELPAQVLLGQGAVPSYYLHYFYAHDEAVARAQGVPSRGEQVAEMEAALLALYSDPNTTGKPELLTRRGGAYYSEAAIGLLASLTASSLESSNVHSANVRNEGTIPGLPDHAVIEATCDVDEAGAHPRPAHDMPSDMAGLIAHVSAYEELAVDAALRGGWSRVYRALLAHPLVGQHDVAVGLADALLAANVTFLPWAK
jgi:6-phospho-beta-glucosidase